MGLKSVRLFSQDVDYFSNGTCALDTAATSGGGYKCGDDHCFSSTPTPTCGVNPPPPSPPPAASPPGTNMAPGRGAHSDWKARYEWGGHSNPLTGNTGHAQHDYLNDRHINNGNTHQGRL
eukprot:scaffold133190_cov48-Phaeocystis_antarctica.AAC.1